MAMNLVTAKTEIETAIKEAMLAQYPTNPGGDNSLEDFAPLAEGISPGIIAALQHILDNAETNPGGETIL